MKVKITEYDDAGCKIEPPIVCELSDLLRNDDRGVMFESPVQGAVTIEVAKDFCITIMGAGVTYFAFSKNPPPVPLPEGEYHVQQEGAEAGSKEAGEHSEGERALAGAAGDPGQGG